MAVVSLHRLRSEGQVTLPESILREAGIEPGDVVTFRAIGSGVIEVTSLPRLTLAEALERFPIDGPIDEAVDREEWEDVAAEGMFRRMHAELEDQAASTYPIDHRKTVEE